MATTTKKIQTLEVDLETRPGSLSKVYGAFKEEKINVLATWAYEMGPGQGKAIIYASDFTKAKNVLNQLGLKPKAGSACYAEGDDAVGAYADLLQKIAKAGVNLHATDAFGVGGKFATVFFADDKDMPDLCKALGC